jgi:hypothetical protein
MSRVGSWLVTIWRPRCIVVGPKSVKTHLLSRFDCESQPNGFSHRDQSGQARVAVDRQSAVKTLTLDASSLGNFGDALGLGEMAQGNQQNAGLVLIFECRFEVLRGKIRVLPESPNYRLVVGDAGSTFHEVPLLIS